MLLASATILQATAQSDTQTGKVFPGADENTPSRSEYFSWLNHKWEGPTQSQSIANLNFFKWLHDTYGMRLDIYALDAGAIDGRSHHHEIGSKRFKTRFPDGFAPLVKVAASINTRLGLWCGPDGFGDTEESAQKRINMMVAICRDYNLDLLKFDACCGPLRPEKSKYFIKMMREIRKINPNLILLNHRIKLSPEAKKHATTFLMGGKETYIDVHMVNKMTCPHHRGQAIARKLPENLTRLTEDCGVCFNSALDAWDDDLILQAFNRSMILAPEIYGNVWDLSDTEFAKLAWIFNIHRRHRNILVTGKRLPEAYGPEALSRGDDSTRLITLRNLSWTPKKISINLNDEIGLNTSNKIYVLQYHPTERFIGTFNYGDKIDVEVPQFRSSLILATTKKPDFTILQGAPYQVIKNVKDKPLEIRVFGMPGTKTEIKLLTKSRAFDTATVDGEPVNKLLRNQKIVLEFPGQTLEKPYHRLIANLEKCAMPNDAESLYEATTFAANNNAVETHNLQRSGPTAIPQVQAARDAFFKYPVFIKSGAWDRFMFDGDKNSRFIRNNKFAVNDGALRIDFAKLITADKIEILCPQPIPGEIPTPEVSGDLTTWTPLEITGKQTLSIAIPKDTKFRYLRINGFKQPVVEVNAYADNTALDRKLWRGSNLFSPFEQMRFEFAWTAKIHITEAAPGSYLCIALRGRHGREGAYVAMKYSGTNKYIGSPDRAPAYPANPWECGVSQKGDNTTCYIPVTKEMLNKDIDVYVLGKHKAVKLQPSVWITRLTPPYKEKTLILK